MQPAASPPETDKPTFPWQRLPRGVIMLGFVSLFMDMSSELVHSLLPALFVGVLGASMLTVGIIEGVAEAMAAITKIFSGALSDYLGRRKILTLIGYGLAAVTKPVFPLADSVFWVFAARFIDRIGKGIRGAPRDALIADLAPPAIRGAAYGLRQSLDTVGAFIGPIAAIALMAVFADDVRTVLWFALLPAAVCVLILAFGVQEPERADKESNTKIPLNRRDIARLPATFWWVVVIGALFSLARFSEAFLTLRGMELGLPLTWTPAIMVLMSVVFALTAYPAGHLSDRMNRRGLLALALLTLILADLLLAFADGLPLAMAGIAVWGLHMGLSQGLLSTLIADAAPARLRGTAFGLFNLLSGLVVLTASVIAGLAWDQLGSMATFLIGGGFALASLLTLPWAQIHTTDAG